MDNIEIIVEYPNAQNVEVIVDHSQPGADGKSAYQIALDNGFEGSEAEWLESLKGEGSDISGKVDKTTTVNGHALSANVTVTKSDVGLPLADNTADANKPVSGPQRTAIDLVGNQLPGKASITYVDAQDTSIVTQLLGGAPTDANSLKKLNDKVNALAVFLNGTDVNMDSILELANAINEDQGLLDALNLNKLNISDVYNALDSVLSGKALDARQGKVLNDLIALNTAAIAANVIAIGLKAEASATSSALALKADKTITVNGQPLSGNVSLTKADVSLGNADNTSDVNKPVSTAQQTALDLKAPLANPTFTTGLTVNTSANSNTPINIVNTNTGTAADARITASNGTNSVGFIQRGQNFTGALGIPFINVVGTARFGILIGGAERYTYSQGGSFGIGVTGPNAGVHIKAGTASSGTAPIKLTTGTLMTTPESGAVEWDGTDLTYTTAGLARRAIVNTFAAQTLANKTLTNPVLSPFTVSTLGAGTVGMESYVTDALSPAIGSTVVGGGSAKARVWFNGANWTVTGI